MLDGLALAGKIRQELAEEIEAERKRGGPFSDTEDLVRRVPTLTLGNLEAMAYLTDPKHCLI